jgi:hypothetical protein
VTAPKPPAGEALLAAVRRDHPAPELRAQTLARALELSHTQPARTGVLPIALPLLLAAAVLLWFLRPVAESNDAIVAEPLPARSSSTLSPPVPVVTPTSQAPAVASAPPPRRAPNPLPPPSLSQELESLERVQAALDAENPDLALGLLDDYGRSGGSRLWAEAQVLRIEALSRSGQSERARELAKDFVTSHPGNPLIDRARAFAGPSLE